MSKNTSGLKPFKPGQSGNPGGRQKLPPEVLKAKKVTSQEFIRVASKYLLMNREEAAELLKNPEASMLELLIGGIIAKAVKDHDYQRANFILDRTIGKVKEHIEISTPTPFVVERKDGTQIIAGAALPEAIDVETKEP